MPFATITLSCKMHPLAAILRLTYPIRIDDTGCPERALPAEGVRRIARRCVSYRRRLSNAGTNPASIPAGSAPR